MKEYFSHDYNTREDEKIKRLLYAHNWIGYGLYWAIIEQLYQNGGFMLMEYERIAFDLNTDAAIIESIICDFSLFKFKKNNFYSQSVIERLEHRKNISEKARTSASIRWNDADAKRTQSKGNAIKEKKNKVKENKEINIMFNEFWDLYDKKKGNKKLCEKRWDNLKDEEREIIIKTLPEFKASIRDKQFQPYPEKYLNQRRWEDEIKIEDRKIQDDEIDSFWKDVRNAING